jgi:hypothetical protein
MFSDFYEGGVGQDPDGFSFWCGVGVADEFF